MTEINSDTIRIADYLKELGYRAEVIRDGLIASATSGFRFSILFQGLDNFQLRCGLNSQPSNLTTELKWKLANQFNSEYRYGKAYIDSDEDYVLEADFLVYSESEITPKSIERTIGIFEGLIAKLVTEINSLEALESTD